MTTSSSTASFVHICMSVYLRYVLQYYWSTIEWAIHISSHSLAQLTSTATKKKGPCSSGMIQWSLSPVLCGIRSNTHMWGCWHKPYSNRMLAMRNMYGILILVAHGFTNYTYTRSSWSTSLSICGATRMTRPMWKWQTSLWWITLEGCTLWEVCRGLPQIAPGNDWYTFIQLIQWWTQTLVHPRRGRDMNKGERESLRLKVGGDLQV